MAAITNMISMSPDSKYAIFNLMGDTLHYDGLKAITPEHHNLLDSDTRFQRLVRLALEATLQAVSLVAQKHQQVRVLIAEGNHDEASTPWMQHMFKLLFRDNPRIDVDTTPFPFYAYLHGDIMLGFHHGHKVKPKELPAIFAAEPRYREMWGTAKQTYIHTGHYHRHEVIETGGAIIVQHPTLSAREAYSARHGYTSWRQAKAYTYHKEFGEVSSVSVVPMMGDN